MRVPAYDQFQVRPTEGGNAPARNPVDIQALAEPARQMQQAGQALVRTGDVGVAIQLDRQKDINEALVRDADTKLSEGLRQIMLDPEQGFLNTQGGTALEREKATTEAIEKLLGESGKGLVGIQQQLYRDVANRRREMALGQIANHTAQQAKVFNADKIKSRADASAKDAVANWSDRKAHTVAKNTLLSEVDALADMTGASPETRAQMREEALTNLHVGVLNNLASLNRSREARAWFAEHEQEIAVDRRDDIRKTLETISVTGDSLDLQLQITGQGGGISTWRQKAKALYQSGEINAETYDALQARLNSEHAQRQQQQAEGERMIRSQLAEFAMRNPDATWASFPPNLVAAARRSGQMDYLRSVASSGGGERVQTDLGTYAGLLMQSVNDPLGFSKSFDWTKYTGKLSRGDLRNLIERQGSINRGEAKAMMSGQAAKQGLALLRPQVLAAGIDPSPKEGTKQAETWAMFNSSYITAIERETEAKGRALTAQEARDLGLSLMREIVVEDGWLSDTRRRVFETDPYRQELALRLPKSNRFLDTDVERMQTFDNIPSSQRNEIIAGLRRRGVANPTVSQVLDAYTKARNAGIIK